MQVWDRNTRCEAQIGERALKTLLLSAISLVALATEALYGDVRLTGPELIIEASMEPAEPAWSPDGSQITFVSRALDRGEIFVTDPDGSASRNLTQHPARDQSPAWSTDGAHIAFVTNRNAETEEETFSDIYVMDATGAGLQRLTPSPGRDYEPSWSSDGRIAFTTTPQGFTGPQIWVMNADGTNRTGIVDYPDDVVGEPAHPVWSPSGAKIAYVFERDDREDKFGESLWVVDPDGNNPTELIWDHGGINAPRFSADGERILYTTLRSGVMTLMVVDSDGQNLCWVTTSLERRITAGSWSPDGQRIVVSTRALGDSELWILFLDRVDTAVRGDSWGQLKHSILFGWER